MCILVLREAALSCTWFPACASQSHLPWSWQGSPRVPHCPSWRPGDSPPEGRVKQGERGPNLLQFEGLFGQFRPVCPIPNASSRSRCVLVPGPAIPAQAAGAVGAVPAGPCEAPSRGSPSAGQRCPRPALRPQVGAHLVGRLVIVLPPWARTDNPPGAGKRWPERAGAPGEALRPSRLGGDGKQRGLPCPCQDEAA